MLKETVSTPVFVENSFGFGNQQSKGYRSFIEVAVRNFIKACLCESETGRYGLAVGAFPSYKSIIDFVHGFEAAREVKLSISGISKLKGRNTISRAVPRTIESESFIDYVKSSFVEFEVDRFFREYSELAIKSRLKARETMKSEANMKSEELVSVKIVK